MTALDELRLRVGAAASDRANDALLFSLLDRAEAWAKDFCRTDGVPRGIVVEMAAHDYALIGAEGVASRGASGLNETYLPDYPERVMSALRRLRRPGVPS